MTSRQSDHLIDILLKTGKLTREQADAALAEQQGSKTSLEQSLLASGAVAPAGMADALSRYYSVPFTELPADRLDGDLLRLVPEDVMRRHRAVPVELREGNLYVAMDFPNNIIALDDIYAITGYPVKPLVALESAVDRVFEQMYSSDVIGKVIREAGLERSSLVQEIMVDSEDIRETVNRAPVIRLVDAIFSEAVRLGASDIHIEPQVRGLFVRYRIDGLLVTRELIPKEVQLAITSRVKIIAGMDIMERRMPQDGQIRMNVCVRDVDFRVSTLPAKYGEKIVIRILDKSSFVPDIEHLGFLPDTQTRFETALNTTAGIILVSGPTGSGKTTTLYAAINRIKSSTKNIITLEDPIEYDLLSGMSDENGITQVQVNARVGLTFALALRSCLRQDPDAILVGEIRDEETCRTAMNAALTGHQVLSTIHTNDASSTVTRLLDMGIESYLITSSLTAVMAQRLVRTLCPRCRESYSPPSKILDGLGPAITRGENVAFYRPKGCEYCRNTGYKGRTGVFELLLVTDAIKDLILRKAPLSAFREEAIKSGMKDMRQHGLQLVCSGITSMAEVMRVVSPAS